MSERDISKLDRKFFIRRPNRHFRLRYSYRGEIELLEGPAKDDFRWFTVVRQLVRGMRVKVFYQLPEFVDPDFHDDSDIEFLQATGIYIIPTISETARQEAE